MLVYSFTDFIRVYKFNAVDFNVQFFINYSDFETYTLFINTFVERITKNLVLQRNC